MIKNRKLIMGIICVIFIVQLASLTTNSNGARNNDQSNYQLNAFDEEDMIDATSCTELAQWDNIYGSPSDVYIQDALMGKIAYVALGSAGLAFYDIANPSKAKFLGIYKDQDGDRMNQLIVHEKYAFITGEGFGLKIVDVGSPKNPKLLMNFNDIDYLTNMKKQGEYIFGLQWGSFLHVIDIANPKFPILENSYEIVHVSDAFDFVLKDDFLYLIGSRGVEVVDITNPRKPTFVTLWDFDIFIYGFDIYGVTAVITDYTDVYFYDISNQSNINLITKFRDVRCASKSVQVYDHYVFSIGYNGFICFDIENPNSIVKTSEYIKKIGFSSQGRIFGEFLYIIEYYRGIDIIFIGDFTSTPLNAGKIITYGATISTVVEGDIAYLANYMGGLDILDIGNPTIPKLISRFTESSSFYTGIYLENNRLYLANSITGNIDILDVSDPINPKQISSLFDDYVIWWPETKIIVKDNIAFCMDNYEYYHIFGEVLSIVNCTDPSNVSVIGSLLHSGARFNDVFLSQNYLFFATTIGLLIYEIDVDYNLTFISEYSEISSKIGDVFVENNTAYLAARDYGLIILDISDIENPVSINSYQTDEGSGYEFGGREIFVENGIIYMTDLSDGLIFFDGTDLNDLEAIGNYKRSDYHPSYGYNMLEPVHFFELTVSNHVVYLSSGYSGLLIVHHDDLPIHWVSNQNIIIISVATTVPFIIGGLIAFVIWRIKKRR